MAMFAPEIWVCVPRQLASSEWQIRAQDKLRKAGSPWEGGWRFVKATFDAAGADCNPDLDRWMHPDHGVAPLMRESTSGQVY